MEMTDEWRKATITLCLPKTARKNWDIVSFSSVYYDGVVG